ncbi:MAG: toluene tolerance protein [Gammaproteobacteria bacterium HGW-Gammaproteobacteria-3]|nr:MAG: toluene tolerance protein [Gammaproteobacteria bacterium HGW-Gammaproteobacteria-3]
MNTKHLRSVLSFTLWLLLITAGSASEAGAAELLLPQQAIENASTKLKQKLQSPGFTKDFAQINVFVESVIYPHVDFNRISALVLGKLWRTATVEERQRFTKEFKTLLVRTYSRAFVEFKDWSVHYLPLKMAPDATKVIVRTQVLQPGIQPIGVDYRMLLTKGEWKVYDIVIEGVSLVTNYRTTFSNEVRSKGSLAAVIEDLATRNNEALASNSVSKS